MRRPRGILVLSILALPACLHAQSKRRVAVQAGGGLGVTRAETFAGPTLGVGATLVWREPVPGLDLRGEWTVQRGSVRRECGLFDFICPSVETHASVTMAAITLGRQIRRGVPGGRRTYVLGGAGLLSGRVTDYVELVQDGCFHIRCAARTEHHPIRRGALTGGVGVDGRAGTIGWYYEVRGMVATGAVGYALAAGLLF